MRRASAFISRFLKDEGEKGSAGTFGKRAAEMSRWSNSSSTFVGTWTALGVGVDLLKNAKRDGEGVVV